MTSPPSLSFAKPAMPGDAVSVLVLAEDSATMADKWPDVRDAYLPNLLENLRAADPSVQMEARWLTTSSASPVAPQPIPDTTHARSVPEIPLGTSGHPTKHSPESINRAISVLSSAGPRQSTTRHLVLVAATGPLIHNDTAPSQFDPWNEIAICLKQQYIRLHVILNIGAEMRTYHELFKRSLQLQNNSEVPAWFGVDSRRYSIRLSGRPQYVRSTAAIPVQLVPAPLPADDPFSNPSPPSSSSTPVSPAATAPSPSSPSHTASPSSRKSSSPTLNRNRARADSSQSPPAGEGGGGLVSYLQQMHGLTKKKSYGQRPPKKTYADMPRLNSGGRPILPRIDVSPTQPNFYTYPTFEGGPTSDPQLASHTAMEPVMSVPRRHSLDQVPSASSLVARTGKDDRASARRRGPWLPIAPLASSTPSSPTAAASPGKIAALQSLAAMTPRLPDFVTRDRLPPGTPTLAGTDPRGAYQMAAPMGGTPPAYYPSVAWGPGGGSFGSVSAPHTMATGPPLSESGRRVQREPATPQFIGGAGAGTCASEYSYGGSPPSSASATPSSTSAGTGPSDVEAEAVEDQPFIVTPEYEALVNAHFEEAVRSGAMQASMTPAAMHAPVPPTHPMPLSGSPGAYGTPVAAAPASMATPISAPIHREQMYYNAQHGVPDAVYAPTYAPADEMVGYVVQASHHNQVGAGWHYPADDAHVAAHEYTHPAYAAAAAAAAAAPQQEQWYE